VTDAPDPMRDGYAVALRDALTAGGDLVAFLRLPPPAPPPGLSDVDAVVWACGYGAGRVETIDRLLPGDLALADYAALDPGERVRRSQAWVDAEGTHLSEGPEG